jgi:hypothetical protein
MKARADSLPSGATLTVPSGDLKPGDTLGHGTWSPPALNATKLEIAMPSLAARLLRDRRVWLVVAVIAVIIAIRFFGVADFLTLDTLRGVRGTLTGWVAAMDCSRHSPMSASMCLRRRCWCPARCC